MYYVYRLSFGERCYIGCTNNIVRRKDQHNENARKGKSKLGKFLKENGIVLSTLNFETLAVFDSRKEALDFERGTALELSNAGIDLLNDNYSRECTRKGKNLGNTAKTYAVVDYINHTVKEVTDLRQYCIERGINYKLIQRTVTRGHYTQCGYVVFYSDDWAKEKDKQKYISGSFVKEVEENAANLRANKTSKEYEVKFPDGHSERVKNLDRFAREHNITCGTLHATFTRNKPTKGYQVIRRI